MARISIRANSLEKTLVLGKVEGKRRGWQRMRWLDSITNSMNKNPNKLQGDSEGQGNLWHGAVHGVAKSQTLLSN